ncbi:MAG TPA: hypothetical protein DEB07_03900 [Candidatus Moranbacteria bacterium]|nr:hypothetical protein [Candidatus Moranbacteria bacterium]HBU25352.1 hypothetical protein [Candidatus Moranbacteria bacterium]
MAVTRQNVSAPLLEPQPLLHQLLLLQLLQLQLQQPLIATAGCIRAGPRTRTILLVHLFPAFAVVQVQPMFVAAFQAIAALIVPL